MKKTSEEWQALNRIWKRLTNEQKELCREDFRIVATSKRFIEDVVPEVHDNLQINKAEELSVKEGCFVELFDIKNKQLVKFKIVDQTRKTHYIESGFFQGHYYYKQEQVLDSGGDGITTVSLESTIGKAIYGKRVKDVVSYRNNDGEYERFVIKNIYKDN